MRCRTAPIRRGGATAMRNDPRRQAPVRPISGARPNGQDASQMSQPGTRGAGNRRRQYWLFDLRHSACPTDFEKASSQSVRRPGVLDRKSIGLCDPRAGPGHGHRGTTGQYLLGKLADKTLEPDHPQSEQESRSCHRFGCRQRQRIAPRHFSIELSKPAAWDGGNDR